MTMKQQNETLRRALEALAAISGSNLAAPDEVKCWEPEFEGWLLDSCVIRDDVGTGLSALHVSMSEWCVEHASVPPTRATLVRLLPDYGFTVADSLVWSLVLKCDLPVIEECLRDAPCRCLRRKSLPTGEGRSDLWLSC
jgi:hypothetical protein